MHGSLPQRIADARKAGGISADTSVVDWFPNACKVLFDSKAGTALHYTTGFEERSCQRYAAGQVKPSADFLRALLRSPQGAIWLKVVMNDCEVAWWTELQGAIDLCSKYRIERRHDRSA